MLTTTGLTFSDRSATLNVAGIGAGPEASLPLDVVVGGVDSGTRAMVTAPLSCPQPPSPSDPRVRQEDRRVVETRGRRSWDKLMGVIRVPFVRRRSTTTNVRIYSPRDAERCNARHSVKLTDEALGQWVQGFRWLDQHALPVAILIALIRCITIKDV
jgi:hypothetical protein